jgi:hypothetical protein
MILMGDAFEVLPAAGSQNAPLPDQQALAALSATAGTCPSAMKP